MPASFQALALQSEVEVALGVALMGIGLGRPLALVPHDHRAAAVLAFRDHALEGEVFDRVVLGVDRQALLAGNEARSAGDGPAFQDAIEFEPQVVMEPARIMLLDAKAVAPGFAGLALRLGRGGKVPLGRVRTQTLRARPARSPSRVAGSRPSARFGVPGRPHSSLDPCSATRRGSRQNRSS